MYSHLDFQVMMGLLMIILSILSSIKTSMRIALKIAYIGTDYHGSQVQPDVKTIEGELFNALRELDIIRNPHDSNYISAGRTDRGVHALGQVVAFDTYKPHIAIPRAINSKLPPSIWVWARAEVCRYFDPRRQALYREYRYISNINNGKFGVLTHALDILKGKHDFSNFSTPDADRTCICNIEQIEMKVENDIMIMDIRADRFLWHMVRKIVTALKMVGTGMRDLSWLEKMFDPPIFKEGIEPAPAYGLILKNVEYQNINWMEDAYSKNLRSANLEEEFRRFCVMTQILGEIMSRMRI